MIEIISYRLKFKFLVSAAAFDSERRINYKSELTVSAVQVPTTLS